MTTTLTRPTSAPATTAGRPDRALLAATGALFPVLVVVGNAIYTDGGSDQLGHGIEFLGYAALAVFLAWVAGTLSSASRIASTLAVIGGGVMLAVKMVGFATVMASEQARTSDVAAGLVQVDEFVFVISWLPYGIFVIGLALAARHANRLSRPIAWSGVAIGTACALAVPLSFSEPFVLPWLLSLLWLIAASILLARGRRRGGQPWSVEV